MMKEAYFLTWFAIGLVGVGYAVASGLHFVSLDDKFIRSSNPLDQDNAVKFWNRWGFTWKAFIWVVYGMIFGYLLGAGLGLPR